MAEHVTQWLGAYHDGELRGARLRQVEQHLLECAECQAELEAARGLSSLLRDSAPVEDFLPAERFAANLALNLPRQSERTQPQRWIEIGWWLVPIGLLGMWLFIQVTFSLSDVTQWAVNSGLFNGNLAWLKGNPIQMEWFSTTMNLLGNKIGAPGQIALSKLNDAQLFISQLTGRYLCDALLAVLYVGWLGAWWLYHQPSQNKGSFSQTV
jgi:hypothetical protein